MEDRSNIRRRQGICNARRLSMARIEDSDVQAVTVDDGQGEVILRLETSSYPAGLTPGQARILASQLVDAADRVSAMPS